MNTLVGACGCHASKQSGVRDRVLISSLPIPYCTISLFYVDFIQGLPRFDGYDSCLVVTCGLSIFTRMFPCSKKITGEQAVKMLVKQWFEPYGAPERCTLMKMYTSAVTQDGINVCRAHSTFR